MKLIPVIDICHGRAVHAVAGNRRSYQPLKSQLVTSCEPAIVLQQLRDVLSFETCYVADLDAIEGRGLNRCLIAEMVRTGVSLIVDAGTADSDQTKELLDLGIQVVVIPSESLSDMAAIGRLAEQFSPDALYASLDLKNGRIVIQNAEWENRPPEELAACFSELGFRQFIVLDLAAVGTGGGIPTLDICRTIRRKCLDSKIITGGGVHSLDCLFEAQRAGIHGVLVSSALHDGRLSLSQIRENFHF
jgi:phosphoribosylformimino-5-aminoimidazole carboxamide ribotide isomerase